MDNYLLLANNVSALGWINLRIHKDSTFILKSGGLGGKGEIYSGSVEIKNDSLLFLYSTPISPCGSKAIISKKYVAFYGETNCLAKFEIGLNNLNIN